MNPPTAIQCAMARHERKPFTYTPGGLDLSEIKSERMARRLMRNAQNKCCAPERPQPRHSPPATPSTPLAMPNFNCLPVQVFPTLNLPANPKSLLRTRSNPEPPREPPQNAARKLYSQRNIDAPTEQRDAINNNIMASYTGVNNGTYNNGGNASDISNNNNRPILLLNAYVPPTPAHDPQSVPRQSYGSASFTAHLEPEISYDAQYFTAVPQKDFTESKYNILESNNEKELPLAEYTVEPLSQNTIRMENKPLGDTQATIDNEQEVKVVKKQVKKVETTSSSRNDKQNGDVDVEAEVVVSTKKSVPKTETKVEVVKKTLPDGSIEEVKTTTTKTTIDGKTKIKTKTETTIIPKEEDDDVEEVEEEEEEQEEVGPTIVQEIEENGESEEPTTTVIIKKVASQETPVATESNKVVKTEERSETTTTKKVVVIQKEAESEEEQEEEEVEEEQEKEEKPEVVKTSVEEVKEETLVKEQEKTQEIVEKEDEKNEEEEETEVEVQEESEEVTTQSQTKEEVATDVKKEEEEEEEEEEEVVEEEQKEEVETKKQTPNKDDDEESEYTEEEYESEKEETPKQTGEREAEPTKEEPPQKTEPEESKEEKPEAPKVEQEQRVPLREPSVPLEKVEDVEIKPIGAPLGTVSTTTTSSTEIITKGNEQPTGTLSSQTEYNKYENIMTVNRTTKILDHNYEQITQQGIPTLKTYFAPDRERVTISPSKPYQPQPQPAYQPPEQPRRHSLLLERLSMERQMPSDIYQNSNYQYTQNLDQQRQWSQEPQSEVVNVSNVKPSSITNQEWFQQSKRENVIYNNVSPSPAVASPQWSQPLPSQPQPQAQPPLQTQYQTSYNEISLNNTSRLSSNTYQQNSYPSYTPAPSSWAGNNNNCININAPQPNQYSLNKDTSESYEKTTDMYSSSYVPPPWEQDAYYVAPPLQTQNFYQSPPTPSTNIYSPGPNSWKPAPPPGKYSKPISTSYVPPAPNQSFVKTNIEPEPIKIPGRKTYYSEYERRYITVPESNYIPTETKIQHQPESSPQYYYDINEPAEPIEPQWRKELREFTEKTTTQSETTSVRPPWEEDPKYVGGPAPYTPSWSQTLRPNRERSFEAEFVGSNSYSKTNTIGRTRPVSSYGTLKPDSTYQSRSRGVSVDRYNPNSYQSPVASEHGPVQAHTLTPATAPHPKAYHNPKVPAYHSQASFEQREPPVVQQQQARNWGDSRHSPLQSRSFKYLQWITGTDD